MATRTPTTTAKAATQPSAKAAGKTAGKPAGKPAAGPAKPSARERLLGAATELFYREGVQTVGIDRIIEHAGVAKASLYNTFGNKEGLVRAYLDVRHLVIRERVERTLTRFRTPRERLLGVFDAAGETVTAPGFNGCAFVAATAEASPGGAIQLAADGHRAWLRGVLTDLATEAGVADPETLAHQLHLLYDGAVLSGRMDRDPSAVTTARAAATVLLDAAVTTSGS
ncbi:TetR/AcrR family transcriptional regulator [Actinacidiphila sp. ITFR-21]|uniref:TetR/AcrR family transcriptional regulator n=1 Tax=Actinacidiphila sp. ITFR-21 TaxID=3075199 RepID=UPI00288BBCEB|nr:TetR/AcrR family transcriptional regulator [Streptomyces sp. ITFR-21]WNI16096.1 TetR/AcrR family transcriptional regulator [Streptomyces sp. ITFR-21]